MPTFRVITKGKLWCYICQINAVTIIATLTKLFLFTLNLYFLNKYRLSTSSSSLVCLSVCLPSVSPIAGNRHCSMARVALESVAPPAQRASHPETPRCVSCGTDLSWVQPFSLSSSKAASALIFGARSSLTLLFEPQSRACAWACGMTLGSALLSSITCSVV